MIVRRNVGDTVNIGSGWTQGANETIGLESFEVFTQGQAVLKIQTQGVTVTTISGNTTELGATATFTVALNSRPTANVTIPLSSSDTTEGTVAPTSLIFTTVNWNVPQIVTVTGVNDDIDDGNIAFTILSGVATGGDYGGLDPQDVAVTNIDDDDSAPTFGWHNARNQFDVNNDGNVTTFDALLVINQLRRGGSRPLPQVLVAPEFYYDVSRDNRLSAADALLVINEIRRRRTVGGEGEDSRFDSNADLNTLQAEEIRRRKLRDNFFAEFDV